MATPNYKLKDDHVACVGHLRSERARNDLTYATKTQSTDLQSQINTEKEERKTGDTNLLNAIYDLQATSIKADGSLGMSGSLQMNSNKVIGLANGTVSTDAVNKSQLDLKANSADVYTKTQTDDLLFQKPDKNNVYTKLESDNKFALLSNTYTETEIDTLLNNKKDKGTFEQRIQNSTNFSSINCNTDRYIEIRSNNSKIADILEDEVNGGFTLNSYNKRINFVSNQPQTYYHNAGTGLFNFKYTDDGNIVPGQLRLGQIQLAPSNTTNLNPALTISSSRVNGLGTVGAIYCDSAYGQTSTPLVLGPQSLTDSNANQLQMYRSTATNVIKNVFTGKTGLSVTQQSAENNEFLTKSLADQLYTAAGITQGITQTQADARYLQLTGGTLTGALTLSGAPTQNLEAATKQYVDTALSSINPSQITDANSDATTTDNYRVKVDNNRVLFQNGQNSDNNWLQLYPIQNGNSSDGTVQLSNLAGHSYEFDNLYASNNIFLTHKYNADANSTYQKSALLRLSQGLDGTFTTPFARISALNLESGGTNANLIFHPKNSRTTSLLNKIKANLRLGYETTVAGNESQDQNSILCRSENDSRYIQLTPTADVNFNGKRITNILGGANPNDVMTKSYIDGEVSYLQGQIDNIVGGSSGSFLTQATADTLYYQKSATALSINADITMSAGRRILISQTPITNSDVVNLSYLNSALNLYQTQTQADARYYLQTTKLNAIAQPTADVSLNSYKLTSVADPTNNQDAATKKYVDDKFVAVGGIPTQIKNSSGIAATAETVEVTISTTANNIYTGLRPDQIRGSENGTTFNIQRGTSQISLFDDGTSAAAITLNKPTKYVTVTSQPTDQDQLMSQRMNDVRYARSDASVLIPLLRSLGVKRTGSIRVGGTIDFTLGNNVVLPSQQLSFETVLIPTLTVTHYVGTAVNYFRCSFTHNFGHLNLRSWVQLFSNRLTPDSNDNDAFGSPGFWLNWVVLDTSSALLDVAYEPINDGGRSQSIGFYLFVTEVL